MRENTFGRGFCVPRDACGRRVDPANPLGDLFAGDSKHFHTTLELFWDEDNIFLVFFTW
jgi:hypothetical protein